MQFLKRLRSMLTTDEEAVGPLSTASLAQHKQVAGPSAALQTRRSDLVYPPREPGLPLADVETSMHGQADYLRRLKVHAATNTEKFEIRFLGPIARLASYVSSLPAAPHGNFSGPGGLFRACVEMGFGCYQYADSRVFSVSSGVEERYLMEVRWRYVCFVSGLLWPLGATLEAVRVRASDGKSWSPRTGGILEWAENSKVTEVHLSWAGSHIPGPASTGAAIALPIVGVENLTWLEEASPLLTSALTGIAAGVKEERYATAFGAVDAMWRRVTEAEQNRRPESYGRLEYGSNAAPHLVDAIAALVAEQRWTEGKTPFFADSLGVYLQWPEAAIDIVEAFARKSLSGMPQTPGGLLTLLEECRLVKVDSRGSLVEIADEEGEIRTAVVLARPRMVIPEYSEEAYKASRTVLLKAIVKADPVSQASASQMQGKVAASVPAQETNETQTELDEEDIAPPPAAGPAVLKETDRVLSDSSPKPRISVQPAPEPTLERAAPPDQAKAPKDAKDMVPTTSMVKMPPALMQESTRAPEGAPISFLSHLPEQWKLQLKRREGEVVGRMIKMIAENEMPGEWAAHPNGVAITYEMLSELVTDLATFLQSIAATGMLYTHPSTPGKLVHDHVFVEGEKKRRCIVIQQFAAKQMGIAK